MADVTDLQSNGESLEDHAVDPDLLALYEVLEWNGKIVPPSPEVVAHAERMATVQMARSLGLSWDERFVTRSEWGARAPRSTTALTSAEGVTAHWEGPHMGVFTHASCAAKVRGIQAFHMDSRGWADIAYNAVVCPHGYIFEGRWAGRRSAANGTDEGNRRSLAICFLSGEGDPWTESARQGFAECIWIWRAFKAVGTKMWPHSHWRSTACPGPDITGDVADGTLDDRASEPLPSVALTIHVGVSVLEVGRVAPEVHVRKAQSILRQWFGQTIAVDGKFDADDAAAVKSVQSFFNLPVTGVIDAATWGLLLSAPLGS